MDLLPVSPPLEAISFLNSKVPVSARKDQLGELLDPKRYFWAAAVQAEAQVAKLQAALRRALDKGTSFEDWKKELKSEDIELPNPTTVWRTNVFSVLNEAKYEEIKSLEELYPYLRYESVEDKKVRPNHAANHGLTMRIDDPRWEGRVPLLGYNCRCQVIQLSEEEAEDYSVKHYTPDPEGLADDPQWGANPFRRTVPKPARAKGERPDAAPLTKAVTKRAAAEEDAAEAAEKVRGVSKQTLASNLDRVLEELGPLRLPPSAFGRTTSAADLRERSPLHAALTDTALRALREYTDNLYTEFEKVIDALRSIGGGRLTEAQNIVLKKLGVVRRALTDDPSMPAYADTRSRLSEQEDLPVSDLAVLNQVTTHAPRGPLSALLTAATGEVVEFSAVSSFNKMGSTFLQVGELGMNVELLVTKLIPNTRARDIGKLSFNYNPGTENEVAFWGAKFKVVKVETHGPYWRVYLEEATPNAIVDVQLAVATPLMYSERELSTDTILDIVELSW